mmetsp:Transcript_19434/g.48564  ORF Transcript_19434/g.48564 Transcript_19434/m.48564 type:complete len:84 (+) Transcript_19434:1610-1861(+)
MQGNRKKTHETYATLTSPGMVQGHPTDELRTNQTSQIQQVRPLWKAHPLRQRMLMLPMTEPNAEMPGAARDSGRADDSAYRRT